MAPTDLSSAMPASNDFATIKIKREFLIWLKIESSRRGVFLYDFVEDLVARSYAGRRVWRSKHAIPSPRASSGFRSLDGEGAIRVGDCRRL